MKNLCVLGSTGSIGKSTLKAVDEHPSLYNIVALSGGNNHLEMIRQANKYKPEVISMSNKQAADIVKSSVSCKVVWGNESLLEIVSNPKVEYVVSAITGSIGLKPTLQAIRSKKNIGLANKETLVAAGNLVIRAAKENNIQIIPIDSEHSAIFQCLNKQNRQEINKLILTASGGSFRNKSREELKNVTIEDALAHPNWSMGKKITIDSATMLNKGLEVIEAHWLFNLPYDKIEVIQHSESIIHSMVEFIDGSIVAQLGVTDMKVPISYALSYPNRLESKASYLDLNTLSQLNFKPISFERWPMLKLAYEAGKSGGTYPAVLNAANEIAVNLFLNNKISFLDIEKIVEQALSKHDSTIDPKLDDIEAVEKWVDIFIRRNFK